MRLVVLAAFSMLIVGCSGPQHSPDITYDAPNRVAAGTSAAPPVQLVEIPKPLPLPGQLKPVPRATKTTTDRGPPRARIDAANQAARREPDRDGFIDAMQVWPYAAGALYQLYTAMGNVTDIALEPGEDLSGDPAGGDTERWEIGSADSGSGASKQVHIFVKPKRANLSANLVITTNRRTYHIELHSTGERDGMPATYMAAISWEYPRAMTWRLAHRPAEASAVSPIATGLDLEHMHHRYRIVGDNVPWRPVDAWDDEHKVFIEMPAGLAQGDAPPLFIIGPGGAAELVNYRVLGHWYVVDRLFAAAELRLDGDRRQTVRIERRDAVAQR